MRQRDTLPVVPKQLCVGTFCCDLLFVCRVKELNDRSHGLVLLEELHQSSELFEKQLHRGVPLFKGCLEPLFKFGVLLDLQLVDEFEDLLSLLAWSIYAHAFPQMDIVQIYQWLLLLRLVGLHNYYILII